MHFCAQGFHADRRDDEDPRKIVLLSRLGIKDAPYHRNLYWCILELAMTAITFDISRNSWFALQDNFLKVLQVLRLTPGRSSVDCSVEVSPIPKIHQSVHRRSFRASISIFGGGKIVLYNILEVKLCVVGSRDKVRLSIRFFYALF